MARAAPVDAFPHIHGKYKATGVPNTGRNFGMTPDVSALQEIDARICQVRGVSVLMDFDLAHLYGVTVSALLQGVRRNRKRFPTDFIFRLTNQELTNLRSQSVISSLERRYGGRRYSQWAFTERGVAMLSSVLRSDTAVRVNIEIMRAFVRLRRAALVSTQLMGFVEDLSKRVDVHDAVIADIVESIRQMVEGGSTGISRPIGFTADIEPKPG
ncbi:MAG TPA: ORF6N domain-containing protein [Steroidobacteraceae bacterium]|nr:ORF6N domain-containing protein [Steroidobacteraceae bacterium]